MDQKPRADTARLYLKVIPLQGSKLGNGFFEQYEGNWVEDKMEGYGTYQYLSGAVYSGEWKNNMHHGKVNT
jgi:hypothetical protein